MSTRWRINNRFVIGERIGRGSFGDIYSGHDLQKDEEVAIKLENAKSRHPQLQYESRIYAVLSGGTGIPNVRWYGCERRFNIMVLDLLGPSLEDCFNYCDRKFSLKTVLMIADALISRIEYVHSQNFLHRDIKPDNFLIGSSKREHMIYAIDFGLAKRYRHPRTKQHMPFAEKKTLTGTPRYASCNNHLGMEQSRRDDLESLGYVFMYFLRGSLPWQGLQANSKRQKYQRILDKKQSTKLSDLCHGFPKEFAEFLQYARRLNFEDKPSYRMLKNLFRTVMEREGFKYDNEFDWVVRRRKALAEAQAKKTAEKKAKEAQQQANNGHATSNADADANANVTPGAEANAANSNADAAANGNSSAAKVEGNATGEAAYNNNNSNINNEGGATAGGGGGEGEGAGEDPGRMPNLDGSTAPQGGTSVKQQIDLVEHANAMGSESRQQSVDRLVEEGGEGEGEPLNVDPTP